jgi:Leucine Rich repeat
MTRPATSHRRILRAMLVGAVALAMTTGCTRKKQTTDENGIKEQPVAKQPASKTKKQTETPKVAPEDSDTTPVKKTGEKPPEKKVAKKADPKPKQPVAKAKPKKKKADELVPISKVTTEAEARAQIKALNPEIKYNSLDEVLFLNFEGTDVTDEHLALLKYFPYLIHLNLTGTKITDAGLAQLKDMERLSELYLYNTGITDKGVKHLAGLTRLEQLCLDKTQITDKGVAYLKGLVELWRLHIQSRNKTTSAVFASLKDMRRLRELHIHGTGFTAESVKEFRRQFPRCQVAWDPADPRKGDADPPRKKGQLP